MLIFMTYNIGLCLAVLMGLWMGYFAFGRHLDHKKNNTNAGGAKAGGTGTLLSSLQLDESDDEEERKEVHAGCH